MSDQNNNNPFESFESTPFVHESPIAGVPSPKKSPMTKIILICTIVAVGIAAAGFYLTRPDKGESPDIYNALENTMNSSIKQSESFYENNAFLRSMYGSYEMSHTNEFELVFNEITGMDGAEMISQLFAGSGLVGAVKYDKDATATTFDAAINLMGTDMLDASVYLSPEDIVLAVPALTDAVLGVDLTVISDDLTIYTDIVELSSSIRSYYAQLETLNYESSLSMMKEINKITLDALKMSTVTSLDDAYGMSAFNLELNEGAFSDYAKALVQYLMVDSEFSEVYSSDASFDAIVANALENWDMLGLDAVTFDIILYIDKNMVKGFEITSNVDTLSSSTKIHELKLSMIPSDTEIDTVTFLMDAIDPYGDRVVLDATIDTTFTDDIMMLDMEADITANNELITISYGMTLDAAAENNVVFHMGMNSDSTSYPVAVDFNMAGNSLVDGDVTTITFPDINLSMTSASTGDFAVSFAYNSTISPLAEKLEPPVYEDITQMSDARMTEIQAEVELAIASMTQAFGLF